MIFKDTIVLNGSVPQSAPHLRNEPMYPEHLANKRGEQYFKLVFEKMHFLYIKYELGEGTINDAQRHILDTQTLVNETARV